MVKEFTVVKRITENKPNWGLTHNKEYAVETNTDFVEEDDSFITVWNDEGKLAEMHDGEYEIVIVDESKWFSVRPETTYVEQY